MPGNRPPLDPHGVRASSRRFVAHPLAAQIVRADSMQPERDDGRRAEESLRPISGFAASSAWSHASVIPACARRDAWEPHLWREMCCVSEPCERRVARDRRETACAGPSPAQVTDLPGLLQPAPELRFPAPSSGSQSNTLPAGRRCGSGAACEQVSSQQEDNSGECHVAGVRGGCGACAHAVARHSLNRRCSQRMRHARCERERPLLPARAPTES